MIVQLVSYKSSLRADSKANRTIEIINSSDADLILFPGHTFYSDTDVRWNENLIENKKTTAVFEVKNDNSSQLNCIYNSLYILQHGVIRNMFTYQFFTDSKEIYKYPDAVEHLMLDLETRRKFAVANRKVIVLQCGENGILRNIQSEGNRAEFRFKDDTKLCKRFDKVMSNTNIILNPMHSPMGNQGKMAKRREYFSANNKVYFLTANFDDADSIMDKSLQHACINGVEQEPINVEVDKRGTYIIRTFAI
jgi:hypothetical protein